MNTSIEVRARIFALSLAVTLCGLGACLPSEYDVEVQLSYPDGQAFGGAVITAIPFDRDALRDSVSASSESPRPDFSELESELAAYERPDLSGLEGEFEPWQAIYDSVRLLADSLNSVEPSNSAGYSGAYARLRSQYQRLAQSTAQRDAAMREHVGDDKDLAMRAAAAADSLRAWEGFSLEAFPEVADSVLAQDGRGIHHATTGEDGTVEFTLAPGPWWFVTRTPDADNPFMEMYWNTGVTVRFFGSKTISLNSENARRRWRY